MKRLTLIFLILIALTAVSMGGVGAQTSNLDDDVFILNCTDSGEQIVGGLKFTFLNLNPGFQYRVTAIGIDGFDPVMAILTSPGFGACNDDSSRVAGSQVAVPGIGFIEADGLSAQVEVNTGNGGNIDVLVGGYEGQFGQFAMIVEGLSINPRDDLDGFLVQVPEATTDYNVGIYMIARDGSNVDPYLYAYVGDGLNQDPLDLNNVELLAECDDVSSNQCPGVPSFPGGGVMIMNGYRYEAGNRDSGLALDPGIYNRFLLAFGSYDASSTGNYGIIVIGTAPGDLAVVPPDGTSGVDPSEFGPPAGSTGDCTNVASTITGVSTEFSSDYVAQNLLDGDPATGWSSAGDDSDAFVVVGLDGTQTIDHISFNSFSSSAGYESDSIKEFALVVLGSDGEPNVILYGTAELINGYQDYYFDPVTTNELGILFYSTHGGSYFEASDIMVCAAE